MEVETDFQNLVLKGSPLISNENLQKTTQLFKLLIRVITILYLTKCVVLPCDVKHFIVCITYHLEVGEAIHHDLKKKIQSANICACCLSTDTTKTEKKVLPRLREWLLPWRFSKEIIEKETVSISNH